MTRAELIAALEKLEGPSGERGVLVVSGVGDMDALRAQIKIVGAEINLVCVTDPAETKDYVIKDILTPLEVREIKLTKRIRPPSPSASQPSRPRSPHSEDRPT